MENGCPVLPKKIKANERQEAAEALISRAREIAKAMSEGDEIASESFMRNVEHLMEMGDPMLEWFIASREMVLQNKDQKKNQVVPDSDDHYSF